MTYREAIRDRLACYYIEHGALFVGYNTRNGSRMYGTLDDIPLNQCIETPVAENLMCGLAIGLALDGRRPVLCIERHDFFVRCSRRTG